MTHFNIFVVVNATETLDSPSLTECCTLLKQILYEEETQFAF